MQKEGREERKKEGGQKGAEVRTFQIHVQKSPNKRQYSYV